GGEDERGRERLDAGLLAGGVALLLEPEEALHGHELGQRGAILALCDSRELLAERREARVGGGLGRRDLQHGVGCGRRDRRLCLLLRRAFLSLRGRRWTFLLRTGRRHLARRARQSLLCKRGQTQ